MQDNIYILLILQSLDCIPPLATIVSPVIYDASSLAKKAAMPLISSGFPILPSGIFSIVAAFAVSDLWNYKISKI